MYILYRASLNQTYPLWRCFMKVYLVQHGKAADEKQDPNRPLTKEGVDETKSVAQIALMGMIRPAMIFHSGKIRAMQTAEIFDDALKPSRGVHELDSMAPNDDVLRALEVINSESIDIMLVGHLPHLSKLVSKLVTGDEKKKIVSFKNSGIICLEKQEDSSWAIVPLVFY